MAGNKEPAIKLFGKTIKLGSDFYEDLLVPSTEDADSDSTFSDQNTPCSKQSQNRAQQKASNNEEERSSNSVVIEECKTPTSPSTQTKNRKSVSKKEDQSDQTSSSQSQDQNTPKKPDKILPCPRCNSMNTKFCYFNNYNVNQPRHFCKNCQRYWTAGGTMRNVPVGAGRRKNKSSSSPSHHRTLVVPEPTSGLTHHGLVQAFGPNNNNYSSVTLPPHGKENLGSNLAGSPIPLGSRVPVSLCCSSTPSWAHPLTWNWQWVATSQRCPDQPCSTMSNSESRSLGKHARDGSLLRVSNSNSNSSSNSNQKNKESAENGGVVIPKTLRIDDPSEAAKSSIWDTLGINKKEKVGGSSNGFFKGFNKGIIEPNHHERSNPRVVEGSHMLLKSNPAAFSRSITFHECAHTNS